MKKFFVIGNPIEHSLSPKVQNQWIKENNIDAVYDKIKLNTNQIKNFIQNIKNQEIAGCNVTIPFKNIVIPFTDNLTLEAKQTQSVNTIVFDNGKLVGHNTDIAGFYKAIKSLNFNVEGKTVLILGAGGVVSSIILALKKLNGKKHSLISSVCISKNGSMVWNYTDKAYLTMKDFSENELITYLNKISDEALYAYNVYQIEGEGRALFSKIDGDEDTIMGLPIKKIKEYLDLQK